LPSPAGIDRAQRRCTEIYRARSSMLGNIFDFFTN
jgi:hypothetical protein